MKRYWRKNEDFKDTVTRSSKTNKTGHSKIMKENSFNDLLGNTRGQTINRMQKKKKNFRVKYGDRKKITEKPNG